MASDDEIFDYQCEFYRPKDCENPFGVTTAVGVTRARGSCDLCGMYRGSWARPHTNEPRLEARTRAVWAQFKNNLLVWDRVASRVRMYTGTERVLRDLFPVSGMICSLAARLLCAQ
jgi:hypothetical protein